MKNKDKKWVFYILLLLIIVGCFLPLYSVKDVVKRCNILTIIVFIVYTTISYILFNSKYKRLVIITQVLSTIKFINLWSNIQDTVDILTDPSIKLTYSYGLGFYFLLVGVFGSIVYYILYGSKKSINVKKKKAKYNYNKITGVIEKVLK